MASTAALLRLILRCLPVFFSFRTRSSIGFECLTCPAKIWRRSLARRFVFIPTTKRAKSRGLLRSLLIALISFTVLIGSTLIMLPAIGWLKFSPFCTLYPLLNALSNICILPKVNITVKGNLDNSVQSWRKFAF